MGSPDHSGISYGVIQKLKNDQENPADPVEERGARPYKSALSTLSASPYYLSCIYKR